MRNKLLAVLCLSTFLFLAGCRGSSDANTNANANKPAVTATPIPKTSETVATDTATVKKVEDALKAKGFTAKNWMTRKFVGDDHSEKSWAKRLDLPLVFFVGEKLGFRR